jgi:hypothetical protein
LQDKCNPRLCCSSQAYYTVIFLYAQVELLTDPY